MPDFTRRVEDIKTTAAGRDLRVSAIDHKRRQW